MTPRRVAITGIGLLTPLGTGVVETWDGLVSGRSAVGPIASYDATSLDTHVGAEIGAIDARPYLKNRRSLKTMTRHDVLTVVASVLAVRDCGLPLDGEDSDGRAALFTAGGKEISKVEQFEEVALAVRDAEGLVDMRRFGEMASKVHPLFFVEGLQGASLFYISEIFGVRGASTYFAGGAEAGAVAVGRAYRAVRRGEADIALAGGGDAPVGAWNMAKLDPLGVLTHRGACRPFDRDRDGGVLGEGGAFLVLEPLEAAQARGANVYAEITGFGSSIDTAAGHATPDPTGAPLAQAVRSALREAGHGPQEVGYVAAHGAGTRLGDVSEARGLARVFGDRAGAPAGSSVKPATGDLVAAAGALNVAVAALALKHGTLPPTLGLEHPDPACDVLDWVHGEARAASPRRALAIARGFEGQNVALALGAV